MDVLERVREVNAGASLAADQISGARSRLLAVIGDGGIGARARTNRRPMFLIAGVVTGVAAAAATVMLLAQLTAPAPQIEAEPVPAIDPRQPGEFIPNPAQTSGTGVTEPFPGTTPRTGQYLSIRTVDESLLYRGTGASAYQWFYRVDQEHPVAAALIRSVDTLYVPADRSGEWVGTYGPANERIRFYPEEQGPAGDSAWDELLPVKQEVDKWTYVGGLGGDTLPLTGSLESYDQYPQDPPALIQYFLDRTSGDTEPDPEGSATLNIAGVLLSNYAPAETRAVFLEALRLSPRAEMVSDENGLITYRVHADGWQGPSTTTFTIDKSTGWATEYAVRFDRMEGADDDMAPTDLPDIRRTFTVSIVDAIP